MRFILVIVAIGLLCIAGLFIYGEMLEPEVKTIEVEVTPDATRDTQPVPNQ